MIWIIKVLIFASLPTFARPANASLLLPPEMFTIAEPRSFHIEIPREMNPKVQSWLRFYTHRDRLRFDRFLGRGALYKSLIQDILVENGVPAELYYLAMIESGFAHRARSHAQAVGIWQFIASTGRRYGLRIDSEVDERLDVIRSTHAAARFLSDLREEFGSWYLAMSAYNCGENCVRRAISRTRTRNFWILARTHALPVETVNYIPKFQAAMTIGRDPERYGFRRKILYDFPEVRSVRVPGRVRMTELARKHGVSRATLLGLNPHLLAWRTPRGAPYKVYLPALD